MLNLWITPTASVGSSDPGKKHIKADRWDRGSTKVIYNTEANNDISH